ncbi:reverse transcriptase domain-containing protein [Tanacetum coccineum]
MLDSQPMEEEIQGGETRDVGTETHVGPTEPVLQTQKTHSPSPAFIKENIDVLRTIIKEHDHQAKTKATPRRLAYADSDKEAPARSLARAFFDRFSFESSGTSETYRQTRSAGKSQRTTSKSKEPTHLRRSRRLEDRSITKEKTRRERFKSRGKRSGCQETSLDSEHEEGSEDTAKIPRNIRVYEGNKDPEDQLGIFSAAAEQEEWPMPVWCKMFCQTLGGAARNWFDDLDPRSVDSFEELSQKFLEEFSQQKRYAKDPTEIHGIKRRQNEGFQAFMDWFKSKSSHIKGVPSSYASQLSCIVQRKWSVPLSRTKGMFIRRGPEDPKKLKTEVEILVMESVSFPEPPPLIETPEKQNLNKFCDYHGDRGHNTNDCYQLKKQIEEVVASGKLAHLRPFKGERSGLANELTFPAIPQNQLTDEPIILEGVIEGNLVRRILIDGGSSFLRRNIPPSGNNRPSSNYGKSRKEQNSANGVCNNKISFAIQHHNRKDRNDKPQSAGKGCKVACDISDVTLDWLLGSGVGSEEVSYRRRGILFHPHAERIKKLSGDTSEDDGKGLGRSKRAKRESIPGRNSSEKQNGGRKVPWPYGDEGRSKSRPRKSADNHPKPHPKSKSNTKFVPTTDSH